MKELCNKAFLMMLRSFPWMFSSGIILSKVIRPRNILDIGCGDGKTFYRLKLVDQLFSNKLTHAYLVGIDIYMPWLKEAKKVYDDVVCCDCRFLPFRNHAFDVVSAFEVVEHLGKEDAYKFLRDIDNIAKKQIIISTPVMKVIQPSDEYEENPFQKHLSSWHPEEMKTLGFKVIGLRGVKALFGEVRQTSINYRIEHPIFRPFFLIIKKVTQLFVYHFPQIAHQQLCIKNKTLANKMSSRMLFEHYQIEGIKKHQFKTEIKHPFHRKRYAVLIYLLKSVLGKGEGLMLDIGCAEGYLMHWLHNYVKMAVGIDISIPKIKRAIKEVKDPNVNFIVASFDNLPFRPNSFDTILWSEGPEHATEPEIVLNQLACLLRRNGILITSTMGLKPPLYYRLFRQLIGVYDKEIQDWEKWGHITIFTPESFRKLISKFFKIEEVIFLRPPFVFPILKIQHLLDNIMCKITRNYIGSAWPGFGCIIIVARAKCQDKSVVSKECIDT